MSIKVKNITKLYGEQKALDEVNFTIKTGEIVGFIGPNGAGKSTMMKIITGFIPQTTGEVLVNNLNTLEDSLEIRKNIGYLPENNPLYLDMYVKEYLKYTGRIYKIKKGLDERVKEIIHQTGLELEQNKRIGALSKGYRQRVGLAQALIHNPDVLILDEPTSGLDPNQIIEIRNFIAEVGREKTVMLSTHIMQEVEAICDRVLIINKGKIVADNAPGNLQKESGNDYQVVVIELDQNMKPSKLEELKSISKVRKLKDKHYVVQGKKDVDIRAEIFQFAVKNKLTVLSMAKQEKSLEEIFQELTKN